jgi:uncharacterized membrane protein
MFRIHKLFLVITIIILSVEILIATYLKSGFIRFTFGDVLASILIYAFIRSFMNLKPVVVAIISLSISFFIEGLQLIHFTTLIHQEHHSLLNIVLGNHFSIEDLFAYTVGILIIYLIDKTFIYETH